MSFGVELNQCFLCVRGLLCVARLIACGDQSFDAYQ